jgi:hypothetical protein
VGHATAARQMAERCPDDVAALKVHNANSSLSAGLHGFRKRECRGLRRWYWFAREAEVGRHA